MENSTQISFTITKAMTMTLYFGTSDSPTIKVNDVAKTGTGNTYTEELSAGSYVLTKNKSTNLYGIKLVEVASE